MDTRFWPGRLENEPLTENMLKNTYDAFGKSRFSELLNFQKCGCQEDAKVLKCSLGSIFLDKRGFVIEQAYYVPHFDEEIGGDGSNFFDRPLLFLLHVYWPEENVNVGTTVPRPVGSCAMKQFHIVEETPKYTFPQMVRREQEHVCSRRISFSVIRGPYSSYMNSTCYVSEHLRWKRIPSGSYGIFHNRKTINLNFLRVANPPIFFLIF